MAFSQLQQLLLHKLSEHPLSGYSLQKEIEKSTGKRPSFGSIYPLLTKLRKRRLVTMQVAQRRKIYTLTKEGKAQLQEFTTGNEELAEKMIEHCKTFCTLTHTDPAPLVSLIERVQQGDEPLGSIADDALRFRNTLLQMLHQGYADSHKEEIQKILSHAHAQLEKLQRTTRVRNKGRVHVRAV